jgi:hypothetical protein
MEIEAVRTLVSERVIWEFDGRRKLEHFWDSHGKLVSFNIEKDGYKAGHFKVVETVEDVSYFGNPPVRFSRWDLYIDGERIAGDVHSILKTKIKLIVGWG